MIIRLQGERVSHSSKGTPSFDDDFIDDSNDKLRDEFLELLDKMASNSHRSAHDDDSISASIAAAAAASTPAVKAPEALPRGAGEPTHKGEEKAVAGTGKDTTAMPLTNGGQEGIVAKREEQQSSQNSDRRHDSAQNTSPQEREIDLSSSGEKLKEVAAASDPAPTTDGAVVEGQVVINADQAATLAALEGGVEGIAIATIASDSEVATEVAPVDELVAVPEEAPLEVTTPAAIAASKVESAELSADSSAETAALVSATSAASVEVGSSGEEGTINVTAATELTPVDKPLPTDIAEFLAQVRQEGAKNSLVAKEQIDGKGAFAASFVPLQQRPDAVVTLALLKQGFEQVKGAISDLKGLQAQSNVPGGIAATQTSNLVAPGAEAQVAAKTSNGVLKENTRALPKGLANRTLERVESALKEAARSRDGKTLSFRLDPPQLGQVKVDVSLKDGALHARMTPENQQVATLLRERAPELQSTFRRLGLNVETVTVSVGNESSSSVSTGGGEASADGKSFQQERKNLPGEGSQVAENTFGNELAVQSQTQTTAAVVTDHWVA